MSITPDNLPRHELIGLEAEVIDSSDSSHIGRSGKVTDETASMLEIDGKMVEKKSTVFLFKLPSGEEVELDGRLIEGDPVERLEKKLPEKWDSLD